MHGFVSQVSEEEFSSTIVDHQIQRQEGNHLCVCTTGTRLHTTYTHTQTTCQTVRGSVRTSGCPVHKDTSLISSTAATSASEAKRVDPVFQPPERTHEAGNIKKEIPRARAVYKVRHQSRQTRLERESAATKIYFLSLVSHRNNNRLDEL